LINFNSKRFVTYIFMYVYRDTTPNRNPNWNSTHLAHLRVTRHVGLIGHWACYTAQLCPFCHVAHLPLALWLHPPPHPFPLFWPWALGQGRFKPPPTRYHYPSSQALCGIQSFRRPSVGVTCTVEEAKGL